jgi:hypothetical protein
VADLRPEIVPLRRACLLIQHRRRSILSQSYPIYGSLLSFIIGQVSKFAWSAKA